jgi:outer membrane protein assembly factor BamA
MGPLAVSIGFPLNDESDDEVQNFQFTFGSFF